MNATQSEVARLESGRYAPRLSTVERYAEALGFLLTLAEIREAAGSA
jgi:predicted transcriptional regulator